MAERRRYIETRTAEIEKETAELDKERTALVAEANELDIAERVLQRYSEAPVVGGTVYRASLQEMETGVLDHDLAEDLTLPQMVFKILEDAKEAGRKGLDSSEIVATIQRRWKPHFTADNVRPTLWRMVKKEGRLRKRGKIYSMPPSSPEGETEPVGGSARN
ncbi:MAG: hypothetical protein P4L57_07375 [Rhizomicrobium sp.]|nr:hypothetical protein [Rhizomicrobium sp.]